MSPTAPIALCAVLLFAVCRCNSFSEADELELMRESEIDEIEEAGPEWDENGNFEDDNEEPGENNANQSE